MPITGNTNYNNIQDKQYINIDADKDRQQQIIGELNKQNIPFSARYDDEKMTVTFSQSDFEKVNSIINSADTAQEIQENTNAENHTVEELQQRILKMQEEQELMKKQLEEQNNRQTQNIPPTQSQPEQQDTEHEEKSVEPTAENKFDIQQLDTSKSKDSYALLPIISSKVSTQQQRIDTLTVKRTAAEEKISMQQTRIDNLTSKAERLTTTNEMLKELMNSKMTPNVVKAAAQKVIKTNEDKIAKIRNEKIPNSEAKIEKQQNKIAKFDRKINFAQCKLNRYTSLNNVITSFSLINNSDRRKQFAAAMDNLHKSSVSLYNAKIDISTAKIVDLTDKYRKSNNPAFKTAALESITRQKISRQKSIDKRNKLIGVIVPISRQNEEVQDEALKQTEKAVNETLERENINTAEMADNIAAAPLPALPEHSITEPDPMQDINRLLPEIAAVMDVSVSEIESKPMDIKQMLVYDYTNNFESTPEDIQESLSAIIDPDVRVEEHLDQNKQDKINQLKRNDDKKENPLKSVEELVEENANMIDGVINNVPPEKSKPSQEEHPKEKFVISRKSMNRNAQRISNEHKQDEKQKGPPEHGSL